MARPPYKAEQRNQIFACFVNAASEILDKEGMEGLTLRKVAQKAGYNSATLYNYFHDLDHLIMYASMGYFHTYIEKLAVCIDRVRDPYQRFFSTWKFFCTSAFEYPHAFYNLFYGRYSGEVEEIIRGYYRVFPEKLAGMDETVRDMLFYGVLADRNMGLLRPLVEAGCLTEEQAPVFNEIMLSCFKELLMQKMSQGDGLDNAALVDKQIGYIHAILRQ